MKSERPAESHFTTQEATLHLETVLWVTRQFLPIDAEIVRAKNGTAHVRILGVDIGQHQYTF